MTRYAVIHTHPDGTMTRYPAVSDKADAVRYVQTALTTARVPLAGAVWRQIAKGLMDSPTGETVLGVRDNHFTIVEANTTEDSAVKQRLEYLRGEIDGQRISYSELAELQSLAPHIDAGDVQLLEWAGVPEHGEAE